MKVVEKVIIDGQELEHFIKSSTMDREGFADIIKGLEHAIGYPVAWVRMDGYRDKEGSFCKGNIEFRLVGHDHIYSFHVDIDGETERAIFTNNNGSLSQEFAFKFEGE